MKDILSIIHEAMSDNQVIIRECGDRIKFYVYPESGDTEKPFITIRPLEPPQPANHASNETVNYRFAIQIDVQSKDRMKCKLIQGEIKSVMEKLGFSQQSGGLDTYFEETKRYVDVRRYIGKSKIYDVDY